MFFALGETLGQFEKRGRRVMPVMPPPVLGKSANVTQAISVPSYPGIGSPGQSSNPRQPTHDTQWTEPPNPPRQPHHRGRAGNSFARGHIKLDFARQFALAQAQAAPPEIIMQGNPNKTAHRKNIAPTRHRRKANRAIRVVPDGPANSALAESWFHIVP